MFSQKFNEKIVGLAIIQAILLTVSAGLAGQLGALGWAIYFVGGLILVHPIRFIWGFILNRSIATKDYGVSLIILWPLAFPIGALLAPLVALIRWTLRPDSPN